MVGLGANTEAVAAAVENAVLKVPALCRLDLGAVRQLDAERRQPGERTSQRFVERGRERRREVNVSLTADDLTKLAADQLMLISAQEVDAVLGSFPAELQADARVALKLASEFGSVSALESLIKQTVGSQIAQSGPSSLGSNLYYLDRKCFQLRFGTSVTSSKDCLLLDEAALEFLERPTTPGEWAAGRKILNPQGYCTGINPYNCPTLAELALRTREVLLKAKALQSAGLSIEAAVETVLRQPVLEHLTRVERRKGLRPGELTEKVVHLRPAEHVDAGCSSAAIANQLNGALQPQAVGLERALSLLPPGYREIALEYLMAQLEVHSDRSLALLARRQHGQIQAYADSHGIKDEQIFYVSYGGKSYGLMSQIYREVNSVPSRQFIDVGEVSAHRQNAMLFVVLDDMAGSGNSLDGMYDDVAWRLETKIWESFPKIMLAPLVASSAAARRFGWKAFFNGRALFRTARSIPTLKKSAYWRQLPKDQRAVLERALGSIGYDSNGLALLFSHGHPDNDCNLVRALMAPLLSSNGRARSPASYPVEKSRQDERSAAEISFRAQALRVERLLGVAGAFDADKAQTALQVLEVMFLRAEKLQAPKLKQHRRQISALRQRAQELGLVVDSMEGIFDRITEVEQLQLLAPEDLP